MLLPLHVLAGEPSPLVPSPGPSGGDDGEGEGGGGGGDDGGVNQRVLSHWAVCRASLSYNESGRVRPA